MVSTKAPPRMYIWSARQRFVRRRQSMELGIHIITLLAGAAMFCAECDTADTRTSTLQARGQQLVACYTMNTANGCCVIVSKPACGTCCKPRLSAVNQIKSYRDRHEHFQVAITISAARAAKLSNLWKRSARNALEGFQESGGC